MWVGTHERSYWLNLYGVMCGVFNLSDYGTSKRRERERERLEFRWKHWNGVCWIRVGGEWNLLSTSCNGRCLNSWLRLLSWLLLLLWKTCGWVFLLVTSLILIPLIEIVARISEVATTISAVVTVIAIVSVIHTRITVVVVVAIVSRSATIVIIKSADTPTENQLKINITTNRMENKLK